MNNKNEKIAIAESVFMGLPEIIRQAAILRATNDRTSNLSNLNGWELNRLLKGIVCPYQKFLDSFLILILEAGFEPPSLAVKRFTIVLDNYIDIWLNQNLNTQKPFDEMDWHERQALICRIRKKAERRKQAMINKEIADMLISLGIEPASNRPKKYIKKH